MKIRGKKNIRIAVAMSGGIDSAVTALLLKQKGFNVSGIFMRNWDNSDELGSNNCPITQDLIDMKEVCKVLKISSHEVSYVKEYWTDVFLPFIETYSSGIATPNPDVYCNSFIKFNKFRQYVLDDLGFDYMATGHYALTSPNPLDDNYDFNNDIDKKVDLLRGIDPIKDQTYFLSTTPGTAFQRVMFPIGHLYKSEVKKIAQSYPDFNGLRILQKKESMGVCFIGKREMSEFLPNYFQPTPGRFIDIDTKQLVGTHEGLEIYTLGQGARIGGSPSKYYIVQKLKDSGDILVGLGNKHPALFCDSFDVKFDQFNWIQGLPPLPTNFSSSSSSYQFECQFQIRHQQKPIRCIVTLISSKNDFNSEENIPSPRPIELAPSIQSSLSSPYNLDSIKSNVIIRIDPIERIRSPTPGQILVLYQDNVCLGGGPIRHTYSSYFK